MNVFPSSKLTKFQNSCRAQSVKTSNKVTVNEGVFGLIHTLQVLLKFWSTGATSQSIHSISVKQHWSQMLYGLLLYRCKEAVNIPILYSSSKLLPNASFHILVLSGLLSSQTQLSLRFINCISIDVIEFKFLLHPTYVQSQLFGISWTLKLTNKNRQLLKVLSSRADSQKQNQDT